MRSPAVVVALGASNTAGYGIDPHFAFPAVIEGLLRNRGIDARVLNAGVSGQPTAGMLARLDRDVPPSTSVVIFQPGSNDERLGIEPSVRAANIEEIERRLRHRGIAVIRVGYAFSVAREARLQADGVHFTVAGHALIAALLVDETAAALMQV